MFEGSEPQAPILMGSEKALMDITPTMTERLQREKQQLENRLAQVNAALAVVESNPQVQQVIDALTKLHWLR